MNILRIRAVGDGRVPFVDESGRAHPGRFFGRGADGAILDDGEPVVETPAIRRAIDVRHSLEEVPEPAPEPAPAPARAPSPQPAPRAPLAGDAATKEAGQ